MAAAAAETELKLWSFGKTDPEVTLRNGGTLAFDPLRDSSGNPVLEIALPEKPGNYPVVAAFRSKTVPARKQKLAVEFEVRGSVPCRAEILIANGEAPYNYLSAVQSFDIPASWKRHRIVLAVTADTGGIGTAALPAVHFPERSGRGEDRFRADPGHGCNLGRCRSGNPRNPGGERVEGGRSLRPRRPGWFGARSLRHHRPCAGRDLQAGDRQRRRTAGFRETAG